jgi:hypothetical protein
MVLSSKLGLFFARDLKRESNADQCVGSRFLQLPRPWCFNTFMRLITAHRILIATSVIFFFGFSYWQLARYLQSGDIWALLQAIGYFLAAIGFGFYFVNIKRWYR